MHKSHHRAPSLWKISFAWLFLWKDGEPFLQIYVSVPTDRYIISFAWPYHRPQKKVTNPLRVGYLFRIAGGRSARFGTKHTPVRLTKAWNQHVSAPEFNTRPHESLCLLLACVAVNKKKMNDTSYYSIQLWRSKTSFLLSIMFWEAIKKIQHYHILLYFHTLKKVF